MRAKGFRDIEAWERQESAPTYPQLEKLAEALKTPVAVFFFPEPPEVPPIRESFRTLPDAQYEGLPSAMHFLLRKAKAFQMNLEELHDGKNPAERYILRDLRFDLGADTAAMARKVREYLGVTLEEQMGWESSGAAFEAWRAVLEGHGVAVFKDAFKIKDADGRDPYSGFCLYDDTFPLIYVNNSAKTRESFTLFHELAHLLFETSGVDAPEDDFAEYQREGDRWIEATCNAFAAEFLLPQERFAAEARGGDGGNYYQNKLDSLGMGYTGLAFSRYRQGRASERELADYLDTKVKHLPNLEDHFMQKTAGLASPAYT